MAENLQTIIEGIGFDSKEASVYLACLELDGAPNTLIARKTRLNRITNYEILKRLEKRGVVANFSKKHTKYFRAIDPRIIIKQTKEKIALAEQATPELLGIVNHLVKKPRIYFFEGIEGIKTIYEDSLNAQTEILTFTDPKGIRALLGDKYINTYVAERVRRKISVRGLAPDDAMGKKEQELGQTLLRTVRLFADDQYPITNEIMIYDHKIALFSGEDEIGLIVENKILAESFRNIWTMAWDFTDRENLKEK
jgi:sugar-specific transcriptional regulator TrmB